MVRTIPSHVTSIQAHRLVQYDVPLEDSEVHREFTLRGIEGRLVQVTPKNASDGSTGDKLKRIFNPMAAREKKQTIQMVRYEVPAEDIAFHSQMVALDGEILEPGRLRPSREVLETGDARLDQRTRVGIEGGLQGGFSTRESLEGRTDLGLYFGIMVSTPWGG
jgi:hypothetical protein